MRRLQRAVLVALAALLLLALGAYLLRRPLLTAAARALVVRDSAAPADLILLLNGRPSQRPVYAAQLYRERLAPRVVLAQVAPTPAAALDVCEDHTEVALRLLRRLGVPDSAIVVLRTPGGVTSTQDEARAFRAHLRRHPARRVLVVTSPVHTRRARWWLRRELRGLPVTLHMLPARDPRIDETSWWQSEAGLIAVTNEYLTWAHNLLAR